VSVDGGPPELAGIDLDADAHDGLAALKELLGQMPARPHTPPPGGRLPRRMTLWGRPGDLADVPPLPPKGAFSMDVLGDYVKEPTLLARHPHLVALRLRGLKGDLEPLGRLTRLRSLDLGVCQDFGDLAPLGRLGELRFLRVRLISRSPVSLAPVGRLSRLTTLRLCGGHVEDLAPLAHLTSLVVLELSHCTRARDLGPLAKLTSLRELVLRSCHHVTDLRPLAALAKLRRLELRDCQRVQDLSPLSGFIERGGRLEVDAPLRPHLDTLPRPR
jgi:hypothetical protein